MYYINMKFWKYVFLIGLICFAILMAQPSYVQASAVVDEIEKAVSPAEEVQIDEPVSPNSSELQPEEIKEQPVDEEEKPVENDDLTQNAETDDEQPVESEPEPVEDVIQNSETEEEQPDTNIENNADDEGAIQNKEAEQNIPNIEPKQQNLSTETPQIIENDTVEPVMEEESVTENKFKTAISEFFYQIRNLFIELYDKIQELKETAIQPSNPYDANVCCRQFTELKQVTTPKNFVPYYFMYPETTKNYLERMYFANKITHSTELLPYGYALKNIEVRYDIPKDIVTPHGITDIAVLLDAPSPKIEVMGKSLFAKLVIDVRNNTLYKYDEDGFPLKAYLIATGARGNRTKTGLRIVTYKEKFPYKGAPKDCKRLTDPYSYGPYIIFMNAINPKTGRQMYVDQFLHGNGNEKSIGRKVSHGCMRTNNNVMRNELSKEVNRGDYVLIINPDIN